jgi:tellurite resistance protein TerC
MHTFWWIGFTVGIIILLILDLGLFNRRTHEIKMKEAFLWSAFWVALSLGFNVFIYYEYGHEAAFQFLAAYFIEKSLSVDNLFVFVMIFSYFKIPAKYQHKVLFWGILGAMIMRLAFIYAGVELINTLHWITYFFGFLLLYSSYKMFGDKTQEMDFDNNRIILFIRRNFPVTRKLYGNRFIVKISGHRHITPLLVTLIFIELSDVIFAVDSIPAVLSISRDTFIIYSSNILAILGLRSLYFALKSMIDKFRYLHYGLAIILGFVGIKMLMSDLYHIPITFSLLFILFILGLFVIISIKNPESEE